LPGSCYRILTLYSSRYSFLSSFLCSLLYSGSELLQSVAIFDFAEMAWQEDVSNLATARSGHVMCIVTAKKTVLQRLLDERRAYEENDSGSDEDAVEPVLKAIAIDEGAASESSSSAATAANASPLAAALVAVPMLDASPSPSKAKAKAGAGSNEETEGTKSMSKNTETTSVSSLADILSAVTLDGTATSLTTSVGLASALVTVICVLCCFVPQVLRALL
jgi:hypothetical protein